MKKSLKILALNWRDPLHPEAGGAEIHLDYILSYLATKYTVVLISTKVSSNEETFVHNGYLIKRIGHPFLFNFTFPFLWNKELKNEKFDIVIDDISKIGLQTPRYIKKTPILALFHHIHGHTLFQLLPFPVALYVFILEKIALKSYINTPMIVVSESSKQELLKLAPFKQLNIIHNGIDKEYLKLRNPKKNSFQFCSIGRLTYAKRVDLSLDVFRYILEKNPKAMFFIAGKGNDEERLKAYSQKLKIDYAVIFLGFISEKEKINLLESSQALLFTSEKEGWGITVIEASACYTPTFGFNVAGVRDSVKQGINGYLVSFGDVKSLAKEIIKYLENNEIKKLQGKSYCYAKNFSWLKISQEIEVNILNQVSSK
ncbi:MAG: glycosyltransferase family 4 protein [Spirochaetota bacterium]|nr:glycosyltransferase family 4 protein [Spirochaetota bacterium]